MNKKFWVHLLAGRKYGALYIGVTSDLIKRVYIHREDILSGQTSRYNIHNLVYFEEHGSAESAIMREKRIKKWRREWKIELIEKTNPEWLDLYPSLFDAL